MAVKDADWRNIFSSYDAFSGIGIEWNEKSVSATEYSIQPKLYRQDGFDTSNNEMLVTFVVTNMPNGTSVTYRNQMIAVWGGTSKSPTEMTYPNRDSMFKEPLVYKREADEYAVTIELWWSNWFTASSSDSPDSNRHEIPYTLGPLYWTFQIPAAEAPSSPTGVKHERIDDFRNDVSWNLPSKKDDIVNVIVSRSVNGGAYEDVAILGPEESQWSDTGCSLDSYYRYKVGISNGVKTTYSDASAATYNTPLPPSRIYASRDYKRNGIVNLYLNNPSATANGTQVYVRYGTNGPWTTIAEKTDGAMLDATVSVAQNGIEVYFKARNIRKDGQNVLVSEWSDISDAIAVPSVPLPPTIVAPENGAYVSQGTKIDVEWIHNSITGSRQGFATVSVNAYNDYENGYVEEFRFSWSTSIEQGESSVSISSSETFPAGTVVDVTVKTSDYGSEVLSEPSIIQYVVAPYPVLSIVSEELQDVPDSIHGNAYKRLTGLPASYEIVSSGRSSIVYHRLEIKELVLKEDIVGSDMAYMPGDTIGVIERYGATGSLNYNDLPTSSDGIEIVATAKNQYGIEGYAVYHVLFGMPETKPIVVGLQQNDGDDSVLISVRASENDHGGEEPVKLSIYRVVGDDKTLITSEEAIDGVSVDRFPPLNVPVKYVAFAHGHGSSMVTACNEITVESSRWWFHWGDGGASAIYDPRGSYDVSRDDALIKRPGKEFAVHYAGTSSDFTENIEFTLLDKKEAESFVYLSRKSGRCVYRSGDGRVYNAAVKSSISPEYTKRGMYGKVSVSLTRIDGDALWP